MKGSRQYKFLPRNARLLFKECPDSFFSFLMVIWTASLTKACYIHIRFRSHCGRPVSGLKLKEEPRNLKQTTQNYWSVLKRTSLLMPVGHRWKITLSACFILPWFFTLLHHIDWGEKVPKRLRFTHQMSGQSHISIFFSFERGDI